MDWPSTQDSSAGENEYMQLCTAQLQLLRPDVYDKDGPVTYKPRICRNGYAAKQRVLSDFNLVRAPTADEKLAEMAVVVEQLDGNSFSVIVPESGCIRDVQKAIQQTQGTAVICQSLLVPGSD